MSRERASSNEQLAAQMVKHHSRNSVESPPAGPERLQKIMAAAGLGSRRSLETQIGDGAVLVNRKPARLGLSVKAGDRIQYAEREWLVSDEPERHQTLIYNKKEGEVTTRSDPENRPTVFDGLPHLKNARWVAIGRLDINTTGLLLLTTDGELAHAMMHPSNQVDREYVCRIRGQVSEESIENLRRGVELEDGPARFNDIARTGSMTGSNQWFKVTILEGRNREVRRLWESQGLTVSRLKRVRYGAAILPKRLRVGQYAPVNTSSYRVLREDVSLPASTQRLALVPVKSGRGPKRGTGRPQVRKKKSARYGAKPAGKRNASRADDKRNNRGKPGKPGSPAGPGRRSGSRKKS